MNPPKKCIAIKSGALLALLLASQLAVAEPAGVVSDSTGPLLAKSAGGSIKVLAVGSSVEPLDTLISRPGVYARVTLTDHSDLALGPDTELVIENYSFHDRGSQDDTKAAQADAAVLRLSKGSVRISSGTLSTRDTDTFTLAAGTATINIHHSVFIATYIDRAQGQSARRDVVGPTSSRMYVRVAANSTRPMQPLELTDSPLRLAQIVPPAPTAPNTRGLAPGLYVQVLDGLINVSNSGGSQNFAAGQFGFTPSIKQPPVILPANPGMQFTPPPAFSAPPAGAQTAAGAKSGNVDCVVR
jgi:FecR protein